MITRDEFLSRRHQDQRAMAGATNGSVRWTTVKGSGFSVLLEGLLGAHTLAHRPHGAVGWVEVGVMAVGALVPALTVPVGLRLLAWRAAAKAGSGGEMPAWALHHPELRRRAARALAAQALSAREEEAALVLARGFEGTVSELAAVARAL